MRWTQWLRRSGFYSSSETSSAAGLATTRREARRLPARRNWSVHAWRAMEGKRCHCIKRIIVVSKQLGPDPSIRGWELGLDNLMFQKPKLLRSPSRPVAIIA